MNYMTTAEIRREVPGVLRGKGLARRMPSSSLIPDDPSLLLTSAGIVQFKPYFLHQKELDSRYIGATTAQKCVDRTNDIDNIGDARHLKLLLKCWATLVLVSTSKTKCVLGHTNSLPRYWGFLLKSSTLPFSKTTTRPFEIWKSLGVPEDNISKLGEEDNFWRARSCGPCGPCSEIYFDQGPT